MMDKKVAAHIRKVSTGSSDAEVVARIRVDLDKWLSAGAPSDDVIGAGVDLSTFAAAALARPAYRVLVEAPNEGWGLLCDSLKCRGIAQLAIVGWRRAHKIKAPMTTPANTLALTWAGAFALGLAPLEEMLRTHLVNDDLTEYPWMEASKTHSLPAQFALDLAASLSDQKPRQYVRGTAPPYNNAGKPATDKTLGALLDFHYAEIGRQKLTTAFTLDPFALIPFEAMAAAKVAGRELDLQHPLLWFPKPVPNATSEHSKWLSPLFKALMPWAKKTGGGY